MTAPLSVIIVDDLASDAKLIKREILKGWPQAACAWVSTMEDLKSALANKPADLVISDVRMPALQVTDVIATVHGLDRDIPIIVASGVVRVEDTLDLLKAGAHDFVQKDALARLNPAIKRELEDSDNRRLRKSALQLLKAAKLKFEDFYENAPDMYLFVDVKTHRVSDCNATMVNRLGYEKDELIGMELLQLYHEDCHDAAKQTFEEFLITGETHNVRLQVKRKDGSKLPVSLNASAFRDEQGNITHSRVIWRDNTKSLQAEEKLRLSEERFSKAFNANPSIIVISDIEDGRLLDVNDAFLKASGYARDDIIGKTTADISLWRPERRLQLLEQFKANGSVRDFEADFTTKSGEIRNAICAFEAIDVAGQKCFLSASIDVTDRKRSEKALRQSEMRLRSIVESVGDGIILADQKSHVLEFNPSAERIFGYVKSEIIGKPFIEFLIPEDMREQHSLGMDRYMRTGQSDILNKRMEVSALSKGGTEIPIEITVTAVEQADGPVFTAVIRDLREQRHTQETLRLTSEKMQRSLLGTIEVLSHTIEQRDPYTAGHQANVSKLAVAISKVLGLSSEKVLGIEMGSLIHDIGKIHIPGEILTRPGKISPEEFNLIKTHCRVGYEILQHVELPWPVADMVLQHHERLDGSGYPQGLKNGEISLESRILAVADVVEAITSHRPYRPGKDISVAIDEITQKKGTHFDPDAVDACLTLIKDLDSLSELFNAEEGYMSL